MKPRHPLICGYCNADNHTICARRHGLPCECGCCACGHAYESHQGKGYFCLVVDCHCPDWDST